ncbi:MAG: VCBS repeat-containing protein [Saprospiraceae bacterium]|nr:VCBS repeat-containing protein [Saprospiraceae bacterium]
MERKLLFFGLLVLMLGCQPGASDTAPTLFQLMSEKDTGIDFANVLDDAENFDVFRYRNYYNGGGVAIGDVNNDGWQDVFLTSNTGQNRLFLNKGNFTFQDITETAGVAGNKPWSTGVALVDVNADGWLDIYVCNSGDIKGGQRENDLFINNGDLTFTESAKEYGLDDKGFSTHACFFDYDGDGDLDAYILNNSFQSVASLGFRNLRNQRDPDGGDKLYRNDGGKFTDVSEAAGIYGSVIGFGLGVTVGDVNGDFWPDIYVSNDFYERDYLYINNQDGTFSEEFVRRFDTGSHFSMGADMADLNNDGWPEIYVTDMLPPDLKRLKQTTDFVDFDQFIFRYNSGYHNQFMHNTLQRNDEGFFADEAFLNGVAATDWSWGALLCDLDNNGFKDIFVTNGVYKDVTDQDFIAFLANEETQEAVLMGKEVDFSAFVEAMPSNKLSNFCFSNTGNWQFANQATNWGLDLPSHSNGAAYGDLDNDGDLDLVVNNLNDRCFVYQNHSSENNSLQIAVQTRAGNPFAVGDHVILHSGTQRISHTNIPNRGFQSSVQMWPPLGTGQIELLDSVEYFADNGRQRAVFYQVPVHQTLTIDPTQTRPFTPPAVDMVPDTRLERVANAPVFRHAENNFIDFDREQLLYSMISREGPCLATADVNADGREDFYVGGASGQKGVLFMAAPNSSFRQFELPDDDINAEDTDALFFDADNDGDPDLYLCSGGSEYLEGDPSLEDRFFRNNGSASQPNFSRAADALPKIRRNSAVAKAIDVNNDGFLDIFVGTRSAPGYYGKSPDSYLLINRGGTGFERGKVTDFQALEQLGMVRDAHVADLNGDGYPELIVAGEWMPIHILWNDAGKFSRTSALPDTEGWWNTLKLIQQEGQTWHFALGNFGQNSMFQASVENPLQLFVHDFDKNGSLEALYCKTENGQAYPYHLKGDLQKEYIALKKKFLYHKDYADKSMQEIFPAEDLREAQVLSCKTLASSLLSLSSDGSFTLQPLPRAVQVAPVYDFLVDDYNGDGNSDLISFGNLSYAKPEVGRMLGNKGIVLYGDGNPAGFSRASDGQLYLSGECRSAATLQHGTDVFYLIGKNNAELEIYRKK